MKNLLSVMPFIFLTGMLNAQAIIHVPADEPTIQAGVDAASNTDTVLVADGTYTGDGNSSISLDGKAIVLKSANGPETCIMDGEDEGYFGFADSDLQGIDVRVEGFTIRNFKGPGFYFYAGSGPDIVGNVIESCSGGIIVAGGDQRLIANNIVQHNTANGMEISNFSGTVSSNIIRNNTAGSTSGGGLEIYRSKAIVMNNLISDNAAKNYGGGIYAREDTSYYINNTITSNNAQIGAGMYAKESSPVLINNIIAHSEIFLWPDDDRLVQSGNIVTNYSYSGGVLAGAIIHESFINKGAACTLTIQVTGVAEDTVFTAAPYEKFSLSISCSTGGYSQVSTEISSLTDTLIITAHNSEIHLNPASFTLVSEGSEEVPGAGLIATESDNLLLKNCLLFGNEGGGFFEGNSEDGFTEVDLDGSNGNLTTDPLLNETTMVPLATSPCIDQGTSETEGIQLPETDVYGTARILDGDKDAILAVDIGACEYEYVPVVGVPENKSEDGNTLQVFPNPITKLAHIQFSLAEATQLSLELYDSQGRKVASLLNGQMSPGSHSIEFDGEALSSGFYFFRLQTKQYSRQQKVLLH